MNRNCADIEDLLVRQSLGQVTDREGSKLDEHLQSCKRCRAYQHTLMEISHAMDISPEARLIPNPEIRHRIKKRMKAVRSCLKIRSVGQRANEKVVSEAGGAGESSGFVDAAQRSLTAFAAARSQDGILRQLLRPDRPGVWDTVCQPVLEMLTFRIPVYQALLGIAATFILILVIDRSNISDPPDLTTSDIVQTEDPISSHILEIAGQKIGRTVGEDSLLESHIMVVRDTLFAESILGNL